MALSLPLGSVALWYVLLFGVSAFACFGAMGRARVIEDPDTRRGMIALLGTSGGWATAHVGFLVVPGIPLKLAFYQVGLIVGLSAVGAWLYFASAYTGRSFHRNPTYRRIAVAVFLGIVLVKVTNPIHQYYYTVAIASAPFPHLEITSGIFHWVAMGLSYALATVGYFMLIEYCDQVSLDTRPLVALILVTGLPIVLNLAALMSPLLVEITYEPIGVAVFAIGVLVVYREHFQHVHLAGDRDDAVIVLDEGDRIRDYNREAANRFPGIDGTIGEPLSQAVPLIAEALEADQSIVSIEDDGDTRFFRLASNPFSAEGTQLGSLLVLTDITHRERYRRELERQNERLDEFASMVSHDLRNPMTVASGHVDLAIAEEDVAHLATARDALDRMDALIEDVLALARQGQPIDEMERVHLHEPAEASWSMVDSSRMALELGSDLEFRADPARLRQLLENLFRNAMDHGGEEVTVRVGALADGGGFYVEDDGPGIPPDERDQVFGSGYTTDDEGTGFGLAIVEEIADAHGWTIEIREGDAGGARFEIAGVEPA